MRNNARKRNATVMRFVSNLHVLEITNGHPRSKYQVHSGIVPFSLCRTAMRTQKGTSVLKDIARILLITQLVIMILQTNASIMCARVNNVVSPGVVFARATNVEVLHQS